MAVAVQKGKIVDWRFWGSYTVKEVVTCKWDSKWVLHSPGTTGLGISFHTLGMNCLWRTGSFQKKIEEIPNEKKYHAHILWKF